MEAGHVSSGDVRGRLWSAFAITRIKRYRCGMLEPARMKITPEERELLQQFAGFASSSLGLPEATALRVVTYLVGKFVAQFNRDAAARRRDIAQLVRADRSEAHG